MSRRGPMGPPWWHHWFRGCGCRITGPRQAILRILSETPGHPTAEEIFFLVKQMHPQVGLATVYRTLALLVNMGLVHRLDFGEGKARYELVKGREAKEHHHHLFCIRCQKIIDCRDFGEKEDFLKEMEASLEEKYRFKITGHSIQFYGVCKECRERQGKEEG